MKTFDLSKIAKVEIAGVDYSDYPDFSDAYIDAAEYDGKQMTNEEIDELEKQRPDFVNELAHEDYANHEPEYDLNDY